MPWKETSPVEERLRFVARLLEGEAMAALCREFGLSRKTGYKIFERYKEHGRSWRPGCLLFQGEMHALVAAVLLGLSGFDAFDGDAETQPPDRE